jgi:arylsulfatase A-like enzyme
MGYGDLGCYGSTVNRTPTIDMMAEKGLRFTDFYMASPVCTPSRGGMLTGCYPPRIGFGKFENQGVLFPGMGLGLNPNETTMAKVLKKGGYHTKIIGKWHCGDQPEFMPLNHGFDEFYGLPYSNDMGLQKTNPESKPQMKRTTPLPLLKGDEVIEEQPDQRSLTERYVEQATDFIRRNKEDPFFLYFAHMHCHLPLYALDTFVQNSQNGDYGACVEEVDWATRCVLFELERQGLSDNTFVLFTSDNGSTGRYGGSNKPLKGSKFTTWEGGLRVPFICYWPGHVRQGVCEDIVASIDFLPTFAKLAGIKYESPVKIDGLDFSPLLFDPDAKSPRDTFFYYNAFDLHAVRCGNWKLHTRMVTGYSQDKETGVYSLVTGDVCKLYNLRDDIAEERDLSSEHPEILEKLQKLLDECRADLGDEYKGIAGAGVRPIGTKKNPKPLTVYDENHPYILAEYDKSEVG